MQCAARQKRRSWSLLALLGVLALALSLTAATPVAGAAKKKKGASKAKVFSGQATPNAAVPDDPGGTAASTPLTSTIAVPKKFKGKVVGDLNVTGIQTTGSAPGAANDLIAYLTAPSGRTLSLFFSIGDVNLGPLTIDDDTKTSICNAPPSTPAPCRDSTATLYQPFAGTANTTYLFLGAFATNGPLSSFNGVPMRGTWTLSVVDLGSPAVGNGTSVLNHWGLQITRAKPPKA